MQPDSGFHASLGTSTNLPTVAPAPYQPYAPASTTVQPSPLAPGQSINDLFGVVALATIGADGQIVSSPAPAAASSTQPAPIELKEKLGRDCKSLHDEIQRFRNILAEKFTEYEEDNMALPETGRMSRQSHREAIERYQNALRKLLNEYLTRKCDPSALTAEEWKYATATPTASVKQAAEFHGITQQQVEIIRQKLNTTLAALLLFLLLPEAGALRLGQLLLLLP